MESRYYNIQFNADLLVQELRDAFPEWEPIEVAPDLLADPFEFFHAYHEEPGVHLHVPDGADWTSIEQVLAAHNPVGLTRWQIARNQIVQTAQSAVGVRLVDLTQAQIKSLIAILLYKAGGVNTTNLTVRPLNEWA